MRTVIAAIDNSAAARPVLAAASAFAEVLHSGVEAVHVREDGDRTARAAADAAGVSLREVSDPPVDALVRAARSKEVRALVLGARGTPVGRHPAGHVALDLITAVEKPLVVVPPHVRLPFELRRTLVPLDGTRATAVALQGTVDLACGADIEVVALHVLDQASLPRFSDQLQYETETWAQEFLARYCRPGVRLELRVGFPGEHVLEVAAETEADMIALGWAQDLSPGRAAVVRHVLARSRIPVLLVPVLEKNPNSAAW